MVAVDDIFLMNEIAHYSETFFEELKVRRFAGLKVCEFGGLDKQHPTITNKQVSITKNQ
jgi:hypothetical protein